MKEEVKREFVDILTTIPCKRQSAKYGKVHWIFAKFSVEWLQEREQKAFHDAHDMLC